ncbi:hypothetical protein ACWATR_37495 [Nostoc sp. UIC 10890]
MQKLKVGMNPRQNPGFEYLLECWNDDPAKADRDQEAAGEVSAVGHCDCGWGVGGLGRVAITLQLLAYSSTCSHSNATPFLPIFPFRW